MLNDLRHAARQLTKHPAYTATAVLTLGLGIGGSTAIFAALERVVLDPLPYPNAERLVRLRSAVPGVGPGTEWDVSEGAWWFFGRDSRTLTELGAYRQGGTTVDGPDGAQRVQAAFVTASTLRMLGARPAIGRLIGESDDDRGAAPVAILSHDYWRRQFSADPRVVGTVLRSNEQPYEIIGVMAPRFELPPRAGVPSELDRTDLWFPLILNPSGPHWNAHTQFRTIATLAPGSTVEGAQAELARLTARLPEVVPTAYSEGFMTRYGFATIVYPLKAFVVGEVARSLWILFGALGLVLIIAYANAANLFLVRAEGRRQEVAIRTTLGAGVGAIARYFIAEGLLLGVAGGAVALVLAHWWVDWLAAIAPEGIPRLAGVRPDGTAVAFAAALACCAAGVLAVVPAVRARRTVRGDVADAGRGATVGREGQRTRSSLVMAQVALALVLIIGAGLLAESFLRLRAVNLGIRADGVVTARLYLPFARYDSIPKMWRFYDAALSRIRPLPGVRAAGITGDLPHEGGFGCTVQGFEDSEVFRRLTESGATTCAGQELNSPGYFEAMGIPVVRGREFTQSDFDAPETGAVVVSQAFAERFWPGEDPLGKGVGPNGRTQQQFYRVVGVVGDVYDESPAGDPAIAIYYPIQRIPGTDGGWANPATLVVRAEGVSPLSLIPAIRGAVRAVDPSIPLAEVREMRDIVAQSTASVSFMMTLLGVAASTALLLAGIGLYGVVSYVVTRRTREIGVRMALGAERRQVARLVVRGSITLVIWGAGAGVVVTLAVSRLLQGLLYGVRPVEPFAYAAAVALLAAVAMVAAYFPARRAARVDPMEALRYE